MAHQSNGSLPLPVNSRLTMLVELPRMVAFRRFLIAIGLTSLLGAGAASAGALVEFPNLPGHTPANLRGYLARPDAGLAAELDGDSPSPRMSAGCRSASGGLAAP
jgi:hypothetical protein